MVKREGYCEQGSGKELSKIEFRGILKAGTRF
jgi:hypothetical protein